LSSSSEDLHQHGLRAAAVSRRTLGISLLIGWAVVGLVGAILVRRDQPAAAANALSGPATLPTTIPSGNAAIAVPPQLLDWTFGSGGIVSTHFAAGSLTAFRPTAGASSGPLPPGWASGSATASEPSRQVSDDTTCGTNSVLLFSARGSGDSYGAKFEHNRVGGWAQGAGIELIHEGWNVRDLQAIYPAPGVPSFPTLAKAMLVGGTTAVALVLKDYRDAATNSWKSVMAELEAAYGRCPSRPILLAGYSQGAILLRYIVPRLPAAILGKIVSVDLIADPTEQRSVDGGLQHPAALDGRLTNEGIDTFAGLSEHAGVFRQTAYPASIRARVFQYCMQGDLVCDLTPANLDPRNALNETGIHTSYAFETIGITAGKRLGASTKGGGGQSQAQAMQRCVVRWSQMNMQWPPTLALVAANPSSASKPPEEYWLSATGPPVTPIVPQYD
jgi:hypothetical protein